MKYIFLLLLVNSLAFSNILSINSFEADFQQDITDDKGKVLEYKGHVLSMKPKFALWSYKTPVQKDIYIEDTKVTIVEPEIEQVIIKHIKSDYDFFNIIKSAKEIAKDKYLATFQENRYTITIKDNKIYSISYKDEFDNSIVITFSKQKQNHSIEKNLFIASFPLEYDLIQD
jgi:outer membrane lipoprotein carrier protein